MALPQEVLDLVEMHPLEDLVLSILDADIPSIPRGTRYSLSQSFPYILVRVIDDWGRPAQDHRFVVTRQLVVHTLCEGLNAEEDAALLGEAVRVALTRATNRVIPGKGWISKFDPISLPSQSPDWATATGPVQYADLPPGVVRYQGKYEVSYRRPPA